MRAGCTARPLLHRCEIALISEALGETTRKFLRRLLAIIFVITIVFAGEQNVQRIVTVIIPLRIEVAGDGHIVFTLEHTANAGNRGVPA